MAEHSAHLASNLGGTRHILQLAERGISKAFHYASTLSVFAADSSPRGVFLESDSPLRSQAMHGSYAQSKWAAEQLVHARSPHLSRNVVYRLGLLTGDSKTGKGPKTRDWLTLTICGLAELGIVPHERASHLRFDVTPLDYAARAIALNALRSSKTKTMLAEGQSETLHLCGPVPATFDQLVSAMRASGVGLRDVENHVFQRQLAQRMQTRPSVALACLQYSLQRLWNPAYPLALDLFRATDCHFDDQNARTVLHELGVHCPAVTEDLLVRYVQDILNRTEDEQT
jgi:thioester reductase-like protein